MKKVAILVNCKAGPAGGGEDSERLDRVRDAVVAAGLVPEIVACAPAHLTERARDLAKRDLWAVIAAGGDGTISAVAQGLLGTNTPLAVLPLGTRNHFAQDLGMPLDLVEAARALAGGEVTRIDVGEVNGRPFINNSSIGLYPEIVLERVSEQKARGISKTFAMVIAALRVLKRFPLLAVRIVHEDGAVLTKTPFVFLGNNEYSTSTRSLGKRERLDGGKLSLYTVRCKGRLRLFWVLVRALLQRLDRIADFHQSNVDEAIISLRRRRLEVAIDGEVTTMTSPLHYKVQKGALAVIAPVRVAAAEPTVELPVLQREAGVA